MKTELTRHADGTVDIVQRGAGTWRASPDELEALYWQALRRSTFGLVRFSHDAVRLAGGWPKLLRFGPAVDGARPILGGLFARRPHGVIRWSATGEQIVVAVERFAPLLRGPFWNFESWFHAVVGRRFIALAAARGG
jgi:hypothetical protein